MMSYALASSDLAGPIEFVADYACETGENPIWHPFEHLLYWCDIPTGRIFRYDPRTGTHDQCYKGRTVGGFTVQIDGSLLLFMDRGTIAVWRNNTLSEVIPDIPDESDSRFNDVIADPRGRVFCGTMSTNQRQGRLYRLDRDGSIHVVLEGIGCANGMAFTLDLKGFFFTDSFAREIYLFDYSVEDGSLSNRRVFARFEEADGMPDGATLDSEGNLWCALWDGGAIVRLDADGKVETRIEIPARKASSLTFGGPDYDEIYITSAGANVREADGPFAGVLFKVKSSVYGRAEFFSRISMLDGR